jgi:hypothetical protein
MTRLNLSGEVVCPRLRQTGPMLEDASPRASTTIRTHLAVTHRKLPIKRPFCAWQAEARSAMCDSRLRYARDKLLVAADAAERFKYPLTNLE